MYLISWTLRNNCSSAWNSSFSILWWGHLLWNLGCCLDLQVCTHSICSFEARQFRWPNKQIQSLPPLRQIPEFFAISAVLSEVLGLANSPSPLETDCFEETAVHGSLIPYLSPASLLWNCSPRSTIWVSKALFLCASLLILSSITSLLSGS